jgi:triacylglycerol lipase
MADQGPALSAADPLTLATLYLCNISYARDITTIPALVQKTPALSSGGTWKCLWGPAQTTDQSNLAFVAGYSVSGQIQSICVTIRGTNIYLGEDIWGIFEQIWQDIGGTSQVPFPWEGPNNPAIAEGTHDGLLTIQGLTDPSTTQTLGDYLQGFLGTPSNSNVTTLVTGHSLGGCLASVVAPWIQSRRPSSYKGIIQPITFAAPTAGNPAFAAYYDQTFTTARRFQNTLDIVPLALQDLLDIGFIYSQFRLYTPDIVMAGITGMQFWLDYYNLSYEQPAQGQQILNGIFLVQQGKPDWYAQALYQHHPATYRMLLTISALDVSALPRSTTKLGTEARIAKRLGSVDDVRTRLAALRTAK